MNRQTIPFSHRRTGPWLFATGAFVLLLLVFFFPVIFQGKVIAPLDILDHLMRPWSDGAGGFGVHNAMAYDAISQYLPYDWTVSQSLKQDGSIGWNPYVYGGYPLLENTMLCPGDWHHQLYRFFEFWTAWDLGIILQFALAGIGMIVMLRGEDLSAPAALVGAIAFAFYSQHVIWIYHRWVLGTSCWFPWIVWAFRRARHHDRTIDFWAIAFTTLSLRGGSLQTCLFTALVVLCLFLADEWNSARTQSPKYMVRTLMFYAGTTFFASLFFINVLRNTVPPFLEGCRTLAHHGILDCVKRIPHLATTFFPLALGTPQTMDAAKSLGCSLFSVRFSGMTVVLLALSALLRGNAPRAPQLLVLASLLCAFTPLVNWFYDRSTVVFGLGIAWLAAWAADNFGTAPAKFWRWCVRGLVAAMVLWATGGATALLLHSRLSPKLHAMVTKSLPAFKSSRLDWMLARSDAFLDAFPPWSAQNLPLLVLAAFGLFAVWRLSSQPHSFGFRRDLHSQYSASDSRLLPFRVFCVFRGSNSRRGWMTVLILCTFGELFVWSRTWLTFSNKPQSSETAYLYPDQPWSLALRKEMSDGGLLWVHDGLPDFDYFQQNAQVGIGLPSAQGYETIRPHTLSKPDNWQEYDPAAFAERGISHVLVLPGAEPPLGLSAWTEVANDSFLHLYRNPSFMSRWHAILEGGETIPLHDDGDSPNRHRFLLPAGAIGVTLSEPYHDDWNTKLDDSVVFSISGTKRPDGGTSLTWGRPVSEGTVLVRSFRTKP